MPQYDSNQQQFYLSLPWRLQATLGSDTKYAEKIAEDGITEASILNATTAHAYLEYRKGQAAESSPSVVRCRSLVEFDKAITGVLMHPSVAERFKPGSGDLWQTVVQIAGPDSSRRWPAKGMAVDLFLVLDEWGTGCLQRVDVVTRTATMEGFNVVEVGVWLTVVHALGHVNDQAQRPRSSSIFDDIAMTRARR